jgi:hypothetical protein
VGDGPDVNQNPLKIAFDMDESCEVWSRSKEYTTEVALLRFLSRYRGQACAGFAKKRLAELQRKKSVLHIVAVARDGKDSVKELSDAESDAKRMKQVLETQGRKSYGYVTSEVLLNTSRVTTLEYVRSIQSNAEPNDTTIIYFSGKAGQIDGRTFLTEESINGKYSYLWFDDFIRLLYTVAGKKILILETNDIGDEVAAEIVRESDAMQFTVLFAASPSQKTFNKFSGGGIFTYELSNALADPEISSQPLHQMFNYVRTLVTEFSRQQQIPLLITDEPDFALFSEQSKQNYEGSGGAGSSLPSWY